MVFSRLEWGDYWRRVEVVLDEQEELMRDEVEGESGDRWRRLECWVAGR